MSSPQAPGPSAAAGGPPVGPPRGTAAWLAAIVLVTLAVRIPTFRLPLDQDGAVFAYVATGWSAGELPYRDAWDHKLPLIYVVYRGLFAVAPPGLVPVTATLRVGSALCDAATALLLFFLARRFFGWGVGVAAALVYGVFTGATVLQGEAFQPERLAALLTAGAMLAAARYADSRKLWLAGASGLLFGLGLIAKQIVAPVGVATWAWLTWEAFRAEGRAALRRVVLHSLLLAAGAVAPWAACAAYFAAHGAFGIFWECTYTYNALYAQEYRKGGLVADLRLLVRAMGYDHLFLWLTGAGGLVAAFARRMERRAAALVGLWVAAAFVGLVLPGQFAFYYYVPTVAPLAVASAVGLAGLWGALRRGGGVLRHLVLGGTGLFLLALLALGAKRSVGYLQEWMSPENTNRVVAEVAREIGAKTRPGDRIYMRGGRPQVYVLSGRRSVSPYMYDFHYNAPPERAYHYRPETLRAIIEALERHKPPYIVVTRGTERGGRLVMKGAYDDLPERFPAFLRYLETHYRLEEIRRGNPLSVMLFRCKDASP